MKSLDTTTDRFQFSVINFFELTAGIAIILALFTVIIPFPILGMITCGAAAFKVMVGAIGRKFRTTLATFVIALTFIASFVAIAALINFDLAALIYAMGALLTFSIIPLATLCFDLYAAELPSIRTLIWRSTGEIIMVTIIFPLLIIHVARLLFQ